MLKTYQYGLMAAIATTVTLASAPTTQAFTPPTESEYNQQLGDRFGLGYDTWLKFNGFVNQERQLLTASELTPLNIEDLTWQTGVNDVEVFFINEGAGYHNQFLYSTDNDTSLTTIFEDASSPNSILANGGPLALGEGRSLGNFTNNTVLSFLLRNPNGNLYGADPTQNQDGLQHITAYESDGYMILGFEDLDGGGDRDYNDVVIAVKGLVDTEEPTAVPEPSSAMVMLGLGLFGWAGLKRQQQPSA